MENKFKWNYYPSRSDSKPNPSVGNYTVYIEEKTKQMEQQLIIRQKYCGASTKDFRRGQSKDSLGLRTTTVKIGQNNFVPSEYQA